MAITKWNNGRSVPINSLSYSELQAAIHEWAEGCAELKELLWTSFQEGIETACCRGDSFHNKIVYYGNDGSKEELKRALVAAERYGNSSVTVSFGKDPQTGPNWHKTTYAFSGHLPYQTKGLFRAMTLALRNQSIMSRKYAFELIAELATFFEDKMTDLFLTLVVRDHSKYYLRFSLYGSSKSAVVFDKIFTKCGMEREEYLGPNQRGWYITADCPEDFYKKFQELIKDIKCKWFFVPPTQIQDDMRFALKAHIIRKKIGESENAPQYFEKWLEKKYPYRFAINKVNS